MSGLLGQVFSAGNVARRKLTDLLGNPILSAQQIVGNLNDRARVLNEMTSAAAQEGVNYGPASRQLAGLLAEAYNPVGMFIGPSSKLWDKKAAEMAKKMDRKFTPEEIWSKTGTFKGKDGKWRQEISDAEASIVPQKKETIEWLDVTGPSEYPVGSLNDLISHRTLLEAYPDVANIRATLRKGQGASYTPMDGFNERITAPAQIREGMLADPNATKFSTLHEIQHAIQQREGFSKGGSPDYVSDLYREEADRLRSSAKSLLDEAMANDPLDASKVLKPGMRKQALQIMRDAQNLQSQANRIDSFGGEMDAYKRLLGEVEAEATAKRMNLTDEQRRMRAPWLDYEFPLDQLTVIMGNNNRMAVPRLGGLLGP